MPNRPEEPIGSAPMKFSDIRDDFLTDGQTWPPHRLSDYYDADENSWRDPDAPASVYNDGVFQPGLSLVSYYAGISTAHSPTYGYNSSYHKRWAWTVPTTDTYTMICIAGGGGGAG